MKNAMFKFSAALTLAAAATSAAYAGGFMLTEQSVAGLGRAYAGSGIVGDDLSAVWYNPAGMVLLPGTQFQMGSVMAYLDLDVETNHWCGYVAAVCDGALRKRCSCWWCYGIWSSVC